MNQMIGEIKLIPYDDVPENKYPKLYMLIGTKFGKEGDFKFKTPDLTEKAPKDLTYCIATEGQLPKIHSQSEENILLEIK